MNQQSLTRALGRILTKDGAPNYACKDFAFKADSLTDEGEFSGYLSIFGEVDSYMDRVMPGAYKKTIKAWQGSAIAMPILWQHDSREVLGQFVEMKEDDTGLWVRGQLELEVQRAREARALMRPNATTGSRAVSGMSIGYEVVKDKSDRGTGIRDLVEIKLWEGSIVTFPAGPTARVDGVKTMIKRDGKLPTLPEFEGYLREAGFSKTEAAAIASSGLGKLLRSESDNTDSANKSVGAALASLKQTLSL